MHWSSLATTIALALSFFTQAALNFKALASTSKEEGEETEGTSSREGLAAAIRSLDVGLLFFFGLWYLGNYFVSQNIA